MDKEGRRGCYERALCGGAPCPNIFGESNPEGRKQDPEVELPGLPASRARSPRAPVPPGPEP